MSNYKDFTLQASWLERLQNTPQWAWIVGLGVVLIISVIIAIIETIRMNDTEEVSSAIAGMALLAFMFVTFGGVSDSHHEAKENKVNGAIENISQKYDESKLDFNNSYYNEVKRELNAVYFDKDAGIKTEIKFSFVPETNEPFILNENVNESSFENIQKNLVETK